MEQEEGNLARKEGFFWINDFFKKNSLSELKLQTISIITIACYSLDHILPPSIILLQNVEFKLSVLSISH